MYKLFKLFVMEINTTSSRMQSLIVLYDMHTTYYKNVLEGISDSDTHNRLNTKANHIAWLAGSMLQQRYEIANLLGIDTSPASNELFKDNKGIQDNITYPSLTQYKKDWEVIAPLLRDALIKVTDVKLNEPFEMMPDMKMTNFELITFFIYREANIIGQLALWRRLLGYVAMKYM